MDGAAGEGFSDLPNKVGKHFVPGAGEDQRMEPDIEVKEAGHIAGITGFLHGQGDAHQLLPKTFGCVSCGQLCCNRLDGGTEFGQRPQLGATPPLAGKPPTDHQRIEGIPTVGREDPDAHPLNGLHQPPATAARGQLHGQRSARL